MDAETIKTYDLIAQDYAKTNASTQNIGKYLDKLIEYSIGKNLLDIGCGHGRDCRYFTDKGFNVTGIDLSYELLKIAVIAAPKARFYHMDMRELKFDDCSFDAVNNLAAFMHLPKIEALGSMKEHYRVLKKGGAAFFSVTEGNTEGFQESSTYFGTKRFFAKYNKDEFEKIVTDAGFFILESIVDEKKWINLFAKKE
jgi:ubiquinone/menaquinone biosynthesis C-methylase UbiE